MSATIASRRVSVVGCPIDALTFRETLTEVERLIAIRRPVQHCVVNASKAVLMNRDPVLSGIVSSCALVNADGQSIVWASRVLGRPLPERVAGIDLFEALLGLAARRGFGVYFLGATKEALVDAVARARREHPTLRICGWHDGYWDDADTDVLVAQVRGARPDILFVGIPSPRKEFWLAEHLEALGVPFSMGGRWQLRRVRRQGEASSSHDAASGSRVGLSAGARAGADVETVPAGEPVVRMACWKVLLSGCVIVWHATCSGAQRARAGLMMPTTFRWAAVSARDPLPDGAPRHSKQEASRRAG